VKPADLFTAGIAAGGLARGDKPPDFDVFYRTPGGRPVCQSDATCREANTDANVFPADDDGDAAGAICQKCLIANECRAWALARDRYLLQGVFGVLELRRRQVRTRW
jgi:hypothetical protein